MKMNRSHVFAFMVLLKWAGPALGALGGADFHASPEHPFGFRGDGSGRFPDAVPLLDWSESAKKNVRWSTPAGSSFSSPVLTEKFVFVTAEPNLLFCIDRSDGKVRWKVEFKPDLLDDAKARKQAADYEPPKDGSGMMAATPLTDGKSIYVVLANGMVCAIDLAGKTLWTAFIDADQITGYGRSSSPIMAGTKLIVHMTNLYAFDAATGKQLWMNKDAPSTYGSPASATVDGVEVIVTPNGELVRASDGKNLASDIGHANHTSPVIVEGVAFFGDSSVNAVKLNPAAKSTEIWSGTITGDVFSSPLLHEGFLWTASAKGELFAFDLKGKGDQNPAIDARALFGEPEGSSPVTYSSMTLAGKYFFVTSLRGDVVILEATRAAKEVAKIHMQAGSGATPVFSGSDMFIRSGSKLLCVGKMP